MIKKSDNKYSIDLNYCKQCGACIAVCNKQAIKYNTNPQTGLLNLSIDQSLCVSCGLCEIFCPAINDFQINDIKEYCSKKKYFLGNNINNEIRQKASSGGITRTIITEGLKNGIFDGVYTLKKTDTFPFAEGHFYTANEIPSINDIPTSIYHSVAAAKEMNQIKKCKRLLIVGTPCQLYALEKYARKKCEELFILCIFCKQQKTLESTRFIAKLAGVKLNQISDLKAVSYRGAGWPGYCVLNGKSVPWGIAAGMPFGKKLWSVPGCDVCGNPFGEHADITVFDPWIIDKSNEDGRNVIAVSSEKGMDIIQSVPNIDITPLSFNDAIPTLMFDDIKKKNKLIPFFRNKETNSNIISHGKKFTKQRQHLQNFLIKSPKYPTIIYKVLGRIIKDPR